MRQIQDVESHKTSSWSDYRMITDRNLFGSLVRSSGHVKLKDIGSLEPTSLKIALLGTTTGNHKNAFAVIEEIDKKKQDLYKAGDSIQGAVVKKVLRGKVILRVNNKDEMLIMKKPHSSQTENGEQSSRPKLTGTTITVNPSDLQGSLKDLNKLLSQAHIRPLFKDGQADGLIITRIKADSFFSKLGLRDGDTVQGIDGESINSPDDILGLYGKLKSGSQVSLQVRRNGASKTINYKFK
ncbi:MAG: PDZ domain-containing protein [Desulfobacteraceae bacterium]|nr:PDZ domain-containing protein [Desulfobacteraceae bacterium]